MPRYFLEVAYKGTRYAGFQIQPNADTIQQRVEDAFRTLFGNNAINNNPLLNTKGWLTCSSRTDAGVHALQNFFHFDWPEEFDLQRKYNLNAILPPDISVRHIQPVSDDAHCRFDATSRTYHYHVYNFKNPFLTDTAYFFPYPLDMARLNEAATLIKKYTDFTSFSKRNTQVKTFNCNIMQSNWKENDGVLIYEVQANRFLRGMVRALTATMLKVGRGKLTIDDFKSIIEARDCTNAFFDVPGHGLTLVAVDF